MLAILSERFSVFPRRQHQDEAITFTSGGSAVWCTLWDVRKPQSFHVCLGDLTTFPASEVIAL